MGKSKKDTSKQKIKVVRIKCFLKQNLLPFYYFCFLKNNFLVD
jgi:hypothetical protein